MYNTQEVYEITEKFFKMLQELNEERSIRETSVNEADKAFGDIRHYCELIYPSNHASKAKVCKYIKDYSTQRREAKDFLNVSLPLFAQRQALLKAFNAVMPEMRKAWKTIENERHYNPRVLNDLFKEEPK